MSAGCVRRRGGMCKLSRARWISAIFALTLSGVIGMSTLAVGVANAEPTCQRGTEGPTAHNPSRYAGVSKCMNGPGDQRVVIRCKGKEIRGAWARATANSESKAYCDSPIQSVSTEFR